MYFYVI